MNHEQARKLIAWQDQQKEGFNGIVTNPLGERGFVSRVGGSFSWYRIGEGQDDVEVMRTAKALHDSIAQPNVQADYLRFLGEQAERLGQPKNNTARP